jgi:hypothetical protein
MGIEKVPSWITARDVSMQANRLNAVCLLAIGIHSALIGHARFEAYYMFLWLAVLLQM